MTRAAANVVIPDLLFQRGNFLTWPYAQKQRLLADNQITVVVNLWTKVDSDLSTDEPGRVYLHWPIPGDRVPAEWRLMRSFLGALLRANRRVLVHCEAGVNRSVWLCALLLADLEDISGTEALQRVEAAIGRIHVRSALREHLEGLK